MNRKKTTKHKKRHKKDQKKLIPLLLLIAFAVIGAVFTFGGDAQNNQKPLGVVLGPSFASMPDPDFYKTLDVLQSSNIKWTRGSIFWRRVETSDNIYDWSKVDRLYNETQKRNINVLINIQIGGAIPNWANGSDDTNFVPSDPSAYREYVRSLVRRMPNQRYYQIGNEPNTQDNWHPKPDPSHYKTYLQAAYEEIKSAHPDAVVLSAGMGANHPPERIPGNIQGQNFIRGLYEIGANSYFDIVSFHPYSWDGMSTPNGLAELPGVISTMEQFGDGNKPLWATEFGAPSTALGLEGQANLLSDQYNNLVKFPEVKQVFWYELRDNDSSSGVNRQNYGLIRTDFSAKPALSALTSIVAAQSESKSQPSASSNAQSNNNTSSVNKPVTSFNGALDNNAATYQSAPSINSASDAVRSLPQILTNPRQVLNVLSGPWGWLVGVLIVGLAGIITFGVYKLISLIREKQKLNQFMTGIHK